MKNLNTHYSKVAVLCLLLFSLRSYAQSIPQTPATPGTQPSLPAPGIVPIGTSNSTDPNYEMNLAKYKDYKEYVETPVQASVQNEAYFLKTMQDMRNEIAEKEKMENKTAEVLGKIEKLKTDLQFLENNYRQLIK